MKMKEQGKMGLKKEMGKKKEKINYIKKYKNRKIKRKQRQKERERKRKKEKAKNVKDKKIKSYTTKNNKEE